MDNKVKTYPEMNAQIKGLLRMSDEPMLLYAASRIEELEERLEKVAEWISVDEALPEESGEVIVHCDDGYIVIIEYSAVHKQFNNYDTLPYSNDTTFANVTHWRPLPAPPEIEEETHED